ncbi:MAG TPA: hypothetical protein VF533_22755 [Solirubrobacteraceae bacterium]|jgi:hypothetical protein
MPLHREDLVAATLELASIAGLVANVCDHAEHNEVADPADVRDAGQRLRAVALRLAGDKAVALYRDRLSAIELRNVVHHADAFDGADLVPDAASWRQLQLIQIEHDRYYHLDVAGLTKAEQLRHYALHLTKLAAAAADAARGHLSVEDFTARRVPDMLLFGLKLATVTGEKLRNDPVSAHLGAAGLNATPAV